MSHPDQESQESPTAAVVVIGNEVLSGKVVDTNSPYLLRELHLLGVSVRRVVVIPDCLDTIAQEVRAAAENHDYVLTSGGVGPTHDDLTLPGVAMAFQVPLKEHPELRELLEKHFRGKKTPATYRMAAVPEGTRFLYGGELVFPLCVFRNVYVFPGVPEILEAKFQAVKESFRCSPFYLVEIYTFESESTLAGLLEQTLELFPGTVIGSYPRFDTREYRVRLTLESKDNDLLGRAKHHLLQILDPDRLVRVVVS